MSDYSYYFVTKSPPTPRVGIWLRIVSYFKTISGWTEGAGLDWEGKRNSRREWEIRKGRARMVGIDHVGCDTFKGPTCRCQKGRLLKYD